MVGESKKLGGNNMNSSEGLNDRYSGKPWTDMVGGEELYHLCTIKIEDEQYDWTDSSNRTEYKVDIIEDYCGLDGIEQSLHGEFRKQNIFDYDKKDLRIELSSWYQGSISSLGEEKKDYYIPNWMCEKIHDWYKENYKKG